MIVFKTFWRIVKKNISLIILYTIMLVIFGSINMTTSEQQTSFTNSKPSIVIINNDSHNKITDNMIAYLKNNSKLKNYKNNNEIKDALFYREIHYIIEIPEAYGKKIMNNENPEIIVKSTNDYKAATAELLLNKYIQSQNSFKKWIDNEDDLIERINTNLSNNTKVIINSKRDANAEYKVAFYFNFASYSIMAIILFIVCIILSTFNNRKIKNRITISKTKYQKHNKYLLYASSIYALIVWVLFIILAYLILGNIIFTSKGLLYILNLFVFTYCILTFALMISSIIINKEALSGIINVLSLGSAFICGAFVPTEWISPIVLSFAKLLPAYWYINTNDLLKNMEVIILKPIIINMLILFIFSIIFVILNNMITRIKQKKQ